MVYKINKTLAKVGIVAAEIIVAGTLAYITGRAEFLALAPILEGILDYLKHK